MEGADPWGFEAFLWLPTPDHEAPSQLHLRLGLAFLRECETAGMPAFVACLAGVGRSPTLVLAHLLAGRFRQEGLEAALDFLSARRPVVHPNPEQVEAARLAAALHWPGHAVEVDLGGKGVSYAVVLGEFSVIEDAKTLHKYLVAKKTPGVGLVVEMRGP